MIRKCLESELETIYEIINDSAVVYKDRIPTDRWKEPYMPVDELKEQIRDGVVFYCFEIRDAFLASWGFRTGMTLSSYVTPMSGRAPVGEESESSFLTIYEKIRRNLF